MTMSTGLTDMKDPWNLKDGFLCYGGRAHILQVVAKTIPPSYIINVCIPNNLLSVLELEFTIVVRWKNLQKNCVSLGR